MSRRLVAILAPIALVLLWPLGIALLWLHPDWRLRDRFIGTLVLPGGWFAAWFIATGVRTDCRSATGAPIVTGEPGCPAPLAYQITHPAPWWGFNHVFGPLVLIALFALPLLAAVYLELQLMRSRRHIAATFSP